ncbi:hypothetical protein BOX15_Mlig012366g1 [Macrostomum lignano]|uniref:Sulfotransfer_1 domain-containing protein n=2 Tax=Macrostomum lignano TaxID=282301 RepID=A0A1I8J8W0_9PLAT|nr:hypothetical protein BOX15_Mlig012366g1 [Macrostomum lignano]
MSSLSKKSAYNSPGERERHRRELSSLLDIAGVEYRFVLFRGVPVCPFPGVKRRVQTYWDSFRPRQSDVWVCTFVKSGTHWVNEIAHMLLRGSTEAPKAKEEFMLERVDCQLLQNLPSPRLMNTHLHCSQLPEQILSARKGKIIFVTRDVRDVAVSLFHHQRTRAADNLTRYDTTWQAHLDTFCKGLSQNGSWFDYIKGWHEGCLKQQPDNVLHLTYEGMLADHRGAIDSLASFLLTPEQRCRLDEAFMKRVQQLTEFEHMRQAHSGKTAIEIYRNGKTGSWRGQFSELDLFDLRARLFDPLSPEDQSLFLHYSSMTSWA